MGSVKDLNLIKPPQETKEGLGDFVFSDRYSVFDWGQMPDLIQDKGKCLCIIGAYFFELFEKRGIPTHYLGLVQDGQAVKLAELKDPVGTMRVKLVRVLKPEFKDGHYDYSIYKDVKSNCLLPLEIIYRNTLIKNSSLLKRIKRGEVDYKSMGFKEEPQSGQKLQPPVFDVSTKLESKDRYMSWEEARAISGVSLEEIDKIKAVLREVNAIITEEVRRLSLENVDGKIELAFDAGRNLMIVDVVGTLDECRFMSGDLQLSKELMRVYYRGTDWARAVEEAKKNNLKDWKSKVKIQPSALPGEFKKLVQDIYRSFTNELTSRKWFDVQPLGSVIEEISAYLKQ